MEVQEQQNFIVSSPEQTFYSFGQHQVFISLQNNANHVYLTLGKQFLTIGSSTKLQETDIYIKISDFIGFYQQNVKQNVVKFTLNAFVKKKKFLRQQKRYLEHYTIYFKGNSQKYIQELKCSLLGASMNRRLKSSNQQQKLMIYFNPNAGSNSKKHFNNVIDFIGQTNLSFDLLQTKYRNHCKQHINNELILQKYFGIVIISGDGLMHQFVNSNACGKVPVTHVPAGSANAFAKYQAVLAAENCGDAEAIYLALKANTKQLNLSEYQLENNNQLIYSFLSFQWCILADLDLNSQFLRFLGGLRFQVYALWRMIKVRQYEGIFTYSCTTDDIPSLEDQIQDKQNFQSQQSTYYHMIISSIPYISQKHEFSPLLKLQDEAMDSQSIKKELGRWQLIKYFLNCDSGNHFDRQLVTKKSGFNFDWKKIKSFRLEPIGNDKGDFAIDGEKYAAQKIQAKISHKKVLTFV